MRRVLKTLIIVIASAAAMAGCASGNNKIWSFDEDSEVQAGAEQHARILAQTSAYDHTSLSDHVDAVGKKIAAVSDRPKLPWHFTVIDSAVPNAFATQGGYVYITRGMLAMLQSDDELAAVLSHEIGHICAQDTPHQEAVSNIMALGVLGTVVVAPALLLFPQVAAAPEGAGMAAMSRKAELNADRLGTEYLHRAGYPPETMQTTMALLESMETYERDQQKAAGQKPSTWWHRVYASHPTTETREKKLAEMTSTQNPTSSVTSQPGFFTLLDGIEFGSAKFEGIPYEHKRYFLQWKLALKVPDGWFVYMDEKHKQLWLVRPDSSARMQLTRMETFDLDNPCRTLAWRMLPSPLTETKKVHEHGPPSCTGLVHKSSMSLFGHHEQIFRAGVIAESKAGGYRYLFLGYANEKTFAENDPIFLSVVRSIEPILATDARPKPLSLHIRRALPGETFASLARSSRIPGKDAESLLRLLNRRYPTGEPVAGELIKTIE